MEKLHSWWEGTNSDAGEIPENTPQSRNPANETVQILPAWNTPRVQVMQALWGSGWSRPGGIDDWMRLVAPLALNSSMSIGHVGAGLGAGTRLIASKHHLWVTGYEMDGELAHAAHEMSVLAGLEKRAGIQTVDLSSFTPKPRSFDCVLLTSPIAESKREAVLYKIEAALKPHGQLLLVDWTRGGTGTEDGLWHIEHYRRLLSTLQFDIRVCEDESEHYYDLIIDGFMDLMNDQSRLALIKSHPRVLWAQMEEWATRAMVLKNGTQRSFRIHAFKTGITPL